MNVPLIYIASSGNEYNLKSDGIRTKKANDHSWKWGVNGTTLQFGVRVSEFDRKPAEYETRLIIDGTYGQRKQMLENLHDDFELDVRNKTPGRVIWGDYYIDCYILASSTAPDTNGVWTDNDVTFYCPYPFWIKEESRTFMPQTAPGEQQFLDYAYDYQYDYFYGNPGIAIWQTDFPFASEFKMTVFGPSSDPRVLINGYPYQFFDTLEDTEYVVIESRNNTITKFLASGAQVNIFDLRNKVDSIFKPIPAGTLTFNWSGAFGFDLTLYEERSEPRWTMS